MWYKPNVYFFKGQCHEVFDLGFFHESFSTGPLIAILLAPLLQNFAKGISGGKNVLNVYFFIFCAMFSQCPAGGS